MTQSILYSFLSRSGRSTEARKTRRWDLKRTGVQFLLDTKFIYSRGTAAAHLWEATIEIGVASRTNKISLPSVLPVFSRTCRFFSVLRARNAKTDKTEIPRCGYGNARVAATTVTVLCIIWIIIRVFSLEMHLEACWDNYSQKESRQLLCLKFLRNQIKPYRPAQWRK